MTGRNVRVLSLLVCIAVLFSGCVGAAVAAGAAGGAGGYRWASGKLSFNTTHSLTHVHGATLSAFRDLDITVTSDVTDKLSGRIKGETPIGESVAVDLEPQGANITKLDIRVGFWGDRGKSEKIADAIKRHL